MYNISGVLRQIDDTNDQESDWENSDVSMIDSDDNLGDPLDYVQLEDESVVASLLQPHSPEPLTFSNTQQQQITSIPTKESNADYTNSDSSQPMQATDTSSSDNQSTSHQPGVQIP